MRRWLGAAALLAGCASLGCGGEPGPATSGETTGPMQAVPADPAGTSPAAPITPADPARCAAAADCAIHVGCCGACREHGAAGLRVGTRAQIAEWEAEMEGVKCDCATCERQGVDPAFVADCAGARCAILDVRESKYTVCRTDADCTLAPSVCCSSAHEPTAFSVEGRKAYLTRWCGALDCPPRALPAYPSLRAACDRGHCRTVGEWKPE